MLTDDQRLTYDYLMDFIMRYPSTGVARIGGLAGTGKTYLIGHFRKELEKVLHLKIAFCTFTGKASTVLEQKLREHNALHDYDYVGTIHGLIYIPVTEYDAEKKRHVLKRWELKSPKYFEYDVIIIDEGSMVSQKIWNDLMKFYRPIIVFGDHGQLEPIGDSFCLMQNPDIQMKQICRQAQNSPIIKLAHFVRQSGYIPLNKKFDTEGRIIKSSWGNKACRDFFRSKCLTGNPESIILCGFNTSRVALNKMVRNFNNYNQPIPYPNERVICLRNNRKNDVMNGQIGTVIWWQPSGEKNFGRFTIELDNSPYPVECLCWEECFGRPHSRDLDDLRNTHEFKMAEDYAFDNGLFGVDFFDFGYAITVHKSQGSEWDNVILFEQHYSKLWNANRFLYTAVTRAKNQLFIISDFYGDGGDIE